MNHKPYIDWMHLAVDGELTADQHGQLSLHLADCLECQAVWEALNDVERLFTSTPMAAPRPGFTGRFKARLGQQRSRPRLMWGALALGLSSVGAAAVVLPFGLNLIISTVRVAQQPSTSVALVSGLNATALFAFTLLEALLVILRAVAGIALTNPLVWLAAAGVIALLGAWLLVIRRYAWEVYLR